MADKQLFPDAPGDLAALTDDEVKALLEESEKAVELIVQDDSEFLAGLSADEVIEQMEPGVAFVKQLRSEMQSRTDAHDNYKQKTSDLAAALNEEGDSGDGEGDGDEAETVEAEVVAEAAEETVEDTEQVETVEELEPILASNTTTTNPASVSFTPTVRYSRTPPAPAPEREIPEPAAQGTALVAAGEMGLQYRDPLTPQTLATLVIDAAAHHGNHPKIDPPGKYRFGGPEHKIAHADFEFPEDRVLDGNLDANMDKIRKVLPETTLFLGRPGGHGGEALVASGGLCAPPTPFYTMPNFGTDAEPVWDALPVFRAARGGVNVPAATYIADITSAISSISEANDALGGTFATKSCQDLDCPDYTETLVQILAHCREYGNLNARAWPEKIAHENALTMQALARTTEEFMLNRIKALSVNVTNGAETLGALIYLVEGITQAMWGIRGRLRMPLGARFRALLPAVTLDLLVLDAVQNQFDRYKTRGDVDSYLRSVGIDPVYYLDTPTTGTTQLPDASQTAAAIDSFPDNIQWAIYPEGAFLGIDSGTLELGIVRDSTLNSTNDFQVFGERFRNVALLGPAQSAWWVTSDICANGEFPAAGTGRTCD